MTAPAPLLDNRYHLDRLLGRGGFTRVYLATDLRLGREVAVKLFDRDLVAGLGGSAFRARFAREARRLATLTHPHILGIVDCGETAETVYLVMPYAGGGTLHDRLRRAGRLAPAATLDYLRQIAGALDYARTRGIIHGDLKPQNLFLTAAGDRLLVADFGLAGLLRAPYSLTGSPVAIGTPIYIAPEQFQGQTFPATDIYTLGCILFECLTGAPPYGGGSAVGLLYGHLQLPVPPLSARGVTLPPALDTVLARALAKRPEERYSSAGELAEAFAAALADPPRPPTAR